MCVGSTYSLYKFMLTAALIPMRLCFRIQHNHRTSVVHLSTSTLSKTQTFQKMPEIYDPETHFHHALKGLHEVKLNINIKNIRNQQRKFAAHSLDSLMKSLSIPLTSILRAYKSIYINAHPFEKTVADLTLISRVKRGNPDIKDVLNDIRSLRAVISKIAKNHASRASNAGTAIEAKDIFEEGKTELKKLFANDNIEGPAYCLTQLISIQQQLRKIPVIELYTPTAVLVGSPNVGKSSIVRAVSSGVPEVNDYPFTTRSLTIGHILIDEATRYQIMDSPGLLDRPVVERNELEKLTYASMAHLPTAIIYVIDPTGTCGEKSNVAAQLNIRQALKKRFPHRPWIDVLTKHDVTMENRPSFLDQLDFPYIHVSTVSNHNIDELKQEIFVKLQSLREVLDDINMSTKSNVSNTSPDIDLDQNAELNNSGPSRGEKNSNDANVSRSNEVDKLGSDESVNRHRRSGDTPTSRLFKNTLKNKL